MKPTQFQEPVTLLVGLGFPAVIDTVDRAYAILREWPGTGSKGSRKIALDACRAGLEGKVDAQTVRATLVDFARRNGILVSNEERKNLEGAIASSILGTRSNIPGN